jgi:hypothetical protein
MLPTLLKSFDFPILRFWAYLKKVIPEALRMHTMWYLRFYWISGYCFLKRRVVMRFVHTTGKTWYKVLYQHTMHVISLSNISIITNVKEISKGRNKINKFVQYSGGKLHFVHDATLFVAIHCEQIASQLVAKATRCDTGSQNRFDLIQSLVPPHYVCNGYLLLLCDWQYQ